MGAGHKELLNFLKLVYSAGQKDGMCLRAKQCQDVQAERASYQPAAEATSPKP